MTQKEFKRAYDKHRIITLNGGKLLPFKQCLLNMNNNSKYEKNHKYFGSSCDRFERTYQQQTLTN